nr:hypothetical protein [Carbonactinospora thermoautotrophica]
MTGLGDLLPRPGDAFGGFRDVTGAAGVDAVREGERQVRSLLGMAPQVYELGETENPRDLVPGNPGEIEESVAGLAKLGDALARTGDAFARIDVGEWHGKAAQSFRRYFTDDAPRWHAAGEAFHQAAAALRQYREALEQAQRDAAEAIRLYREGEQASEAAREAYNRQVDAYNRAVQAATASGGPVLPRRVRSPIPGSTCVSRPSGFSTPPVSTCGRPGTRPLAWSGRPRSRRPRSRGCSAGWPCPPPTWSGWVTRSRSRCSRARPSRSRA